MKANIAEELPIEKNDLLIKRVGQLPQVQSIHPFATKYAILKTSGDMEGVLVKGLDSTYNFSHLSGFLKKGRWIHFGDSSYSRELVISAYTAKQLKLSVNDRILIYFVRPDGSLRPDKLTIVGIYKTSIEEYDKTFAIGDIKLIQRLNSWGKSDIGGYEIFLQDYHQMDEASNEIYNDVFFPQLWETKTVKEIYPNIFDWLQIQNTNQGILITIMVIIAVINLITCLIILVLERLRMIGVLKALGATNWSVQKIFLHHSALITFTGIIIGTVLGLGFLWLQLKTGFIRLEEEAYYMETAAVKIEWWQIIAVGAGTLTVSFLVLLIPSFIVRNVRPVKAIHFR
jgi:lipoprotein-releasing system permease protein